MDTVRLILPKERTGIPDLLKTIPSRLPEHSTHWYPDGRIYQIGYCDSMKITVAEKYVKIENSLAKYMFGSNIHTPRLKDIRIAVEKLSDQLGLPIAKALVRRVDVPKNIPIKHPASLYIAHLGDLGRFKRIPIPDGVSYRINSRQYVFYDKINELKNKGEDIPEEYQLSNVLRFEGRYLSRLRSYFKRAEITASSLYNEKFYIEICRDVRQAYQDIEKMGRTEIDFRKINDIKTLREASIPFLADAIGGPDMLCQRFEEQYKLGLFSQTELRRIKNFIKKCCGNSIASVPSELILELDDIVDIAFKNCR